MTDKKDPDILTSILTSILALLLILPGAAWSGFVLSIMWGWFVVPLGVVPIGIWHAAGLSMVAGWMAGVTSRDDDRSPGESIAIMLIVPAICWAFGAFYHWMMV